MSKRKFTREHNDLDWLFPTIPDLEEVESGQTAFDHFEALANDLFETAHNGETAFAKEDLIDAFMKGASEAYREIGYFLFQKHQLNLTLKRIREQDL